MAQKAFLTMLEPFELDKPVNIERAPIIAAKVAATAMSVSTGIYFLATATDMLHPLKGTGIVPTAIDLVDKLGAGIITGALVGTLAQIAVSTPLKYNYNKLLRPYRPGGSIIDQMYFEGHITKEYWHTLYEYQGWPEDLIEAQFKTMFIEPSDRMLLAMFEDPELSEPWIKAKLKERGYDAADVLEMTRFGKSRALDKTRLTRLSSITSRYNKGYLNKESLPSWLATLEYRKDQANKIIISADLDADTNLRDLLLNGYTTMFVDNQISEADFIKNLQPLIINTNYRNAYLQLQKSKRLGKLDNDAKVKQYEGSKSVAISRFVEGLTDESKLASELKLLNITPAETPLIITEAKLKKDLEDYKDKQAKIKADTVKAKSGKETNSITRFVQGYTTREILQAELSTLGKSAEEIKLILLQANLQKDTDYRKDQLALYKVAYQKDIIERDEFIKSVRPLISDNTTFEQTIILEDLKKQPKPKASKTE